jgi:hypothetical protein
MATILNVFKYLGLVIRILRVVDAVYPQIEAIIEVNKESTKQISGRQKKLNVKERLLKRERIAKEFNHKGLENTIERAVELMNEVKVYGNTT